MAGSKLNVCRILKKKCFTVCKTFAEFSLIAVKQDFNRIMKELLRAYWCSKIVDSKHNVQRILYGRIQTEFL
jgi:hypothetical protein